MHMGPHDCGSHKSICVYLSLFEVKEFSYFKSKAEFSMILDFTLTFNYICMIFIVGRAIRHINDYAAILLVDTRYASDSTKRSISHPVNKLPQWIKDRLVSSTRNYGEVHKLVHQFFKFNRRGCQYNT